MRTLKTHTLLGALVLSLVSILVSAPAMAVSLASAIVIDDFEDGDASDWNFFGGNAAGGGGGISSDRPFEGAFYFSTGWGGNGSNSVFYGGAFKNFDDASQVVPPADPWFNVWVLNQSDATVDQYTLEVTLREDLNGDGWTDGVEDSFRLDATFPASSFDDQWTQISAPLSSFNNLFTGGDGVFNGNLDEIVIVIAGVQGADGTTVEVDFDFFAFSSGGPLGEVVFDDMEHGDPFGNGWFAFGGSVGGGGIDANFVDLPPANGGAVSLQTGWGSGGVPGFFGGFGRTNPVDLTGTNTFNFWINPDAGQDYTLEINLQDDDNGDNAISQPDDDEFQFNCVVSPTGPCAVSGGGWQLVSIPLEDFFDDNSFLFGGNGILDPVPATNGGNGQLINVVYAVISNSGSDVTFRTDYWLFSDGSASPPVVGTIIDDFENGLPSGSDGNGTPIGFYTFSDGSPIAIIDELTPPAPELPAVGTPNNVMKMTLDVTAFAGYIHGFENDAVDTWVSQDWSTSEGIAFWIYGQNSGTQMFLDVLDNRTPGSTSDDAERWTVNFSDNFTGWKQFTFPFSSFVRKEIGNGAPNDGFGRFEVWGYAIGTLATPGEISIYIDNVALYGTVEPPALAVSFLLQNTFIEEGVTGDVEVKLNRPMNADDPSEVSIDFRTEVGTAVPGDDYTPVSGTLTFVNGGPSQLAFPVETFDNTKFTGLKRIGLRLTNPVDVERSSPFQASVLIDDNDPYDPNLVDDFEQGAFLWEDDGWVEIDARRVEIGGADERPGQDVVEYVLAASVPADETAVFTEIEIVAESLEALLPASDDSVGHRIEKAIGRLDDALDPDNWENGFFLDDKGGKHFYDRLEQAVRELAMVAASGAPEAGAAQDAIDELIVFAAALAENAVFVAELNGADAESVDKAIGEIAKAEAQLDAGNPEKAVSHYKKAWQTATQATVELNGRELLPIASLNHDFAISQDWTGTGSLDLWFKGTASGQQITVTLKDNRAPDPGPSGWNLVWSDEFNGAAGEPPNPDNWSFQLSDVDPYGNLGWGNSELQYYTDDPDNVYTDGNGNLVISLSEADGSVECFYGPCEFDSARLITKHKAEFAYGRIEARIRVPNGGSGLWPAFWSLGTDIDRNPWPGAGEIDFMEYVSRLPNEIFGTIHGPGYAGGQSFGNLFDFGQPVSDTYHTFTVEWEPESITWYVDGIEYHQATPDDVAPNEWVFEKPFFLLLNQAVGGNFGGAIDPDLTLPQDYVIDYVRVYQGPDSAERFEASFTDSSTDWQPVSIPMSEFVRSAEQPSGAPDDGLGLDEVWGYGFDLPYPAAGTYLIDQARITPEP